MPVSLLLCEGVEHSPDMRVLSKLLCGICNIKPEGSKYGMGNKIISLREERHSHTVFGIIDRDFRNEWKTPENRAEPWESKDHNLQFGWYWERKEIENYIIDPVVVARALAEHAPNQADYLMALESARDCISIYQAARIALSASRIRFKALPSSFGRERGEEKHLFPDVLDKKSCDDEIKKIVEKHAETLHVSVIKVYAAFQCYLAECQNGSRYQHYLHAFAGKDLLWAMNQWCADNGFISAWAFRGKILKGIYSATDDISTWLPEWQDLKERITGI